VIGQSGRESDRSFLVPDSYGPKVAGSTV
jgi:hypothetical protein